MNPIRFVRAAWCLCLCLSFSCGSFAAAAAAGLSESFEDGVPAIYQADGGRLGVTSGHVIDGRQALRWDFKAGDAFVIRTGPLGNVGVWTGYGGYSRSALVMPLFLPATGPGHMLIEVRAGEETAATITVPLAHAGWQKLVYHYSWQSGMTWTDRKLADRLDNLRVSAQGTEGASYACFDGLFYNDPRDFRDACGAVTKPWKPASHDFSNRPHPSADDLAKLDALARLLRAAPNPGLSADHWAKRIEHLRGQVATNGYSKGHPVTKGLAEYFGFLNTVADEWCRCVDPASREQLAEIFHTVNDWLHEQGLVVNGALGKADNYVGRLYVDAATKMRDALAAHGSLERTLDYLKWSYEYDEQVFSSSHDRSMDYFHNEALRLLRIAAAEGDPVLRWHHVDSIREALAMQLTTSIKPDGSLFHHGFHYFAYGSMGMNSISGTLALMSEAGLPVSEEGLDAVRLALEQMRWYSCGTTLWSLSGRAATGTMQPPVGAFLSLARAYAPYRSGKPDPGLMAAHLRYRPGDAAKPEFSGFQAEPPPEGFRTMPYAALAMHRRDHWLVGIKGYSRYAASGESYANANRHGLYLSHGQMEILSHPLPMPTVNGSGTRPNEGYDWLAIEGVTAAYSTLKHIANGNGTRIPHSSEAFVGGVSIGSNGLFAMVLNDSSTAGIMRERPKEDPAPTSLRALKTWFCFDNRIVCLGSDISVANLPFPIRTTLFQKFLDDAFDTTLLNGTAIRATGESLNHEATGGPSLLVDPYGNAYRIAADARVNLRVGPQISRNPDDNQDTRGTYATAWIDHGLNPSNGGYEYAVLIQAAAADIEVFAAQPGYQVLRRDAKAHVVRDESTSSTGHAIFEAGEEMPEGTPLLAAAQPCLVMIEEHEDHLILALADPDPRPNAKESAELSVTVRGQFDSPSSRVKVETGTTTVTIAMPHAQSGVVLLNKRKRP